MFSFLSPFVSAAEATKYDKTVKEGERAAAQIPQAQAQAVSSPLTAQTNKDESLKQSQKIAANPPEPAISAVTEAAVKSGVLTCARRIEQVIKFLTNGTEQSGALLYMPQTQPDEGVFSVSLELDGAKGTVAYAAASFYPEKTGGCSASYDLVEYSERPCSYFKAAPAEGKAQPPSVLKRDIGVIGLGSVKIFLMPSGRGCTVIKREVLN